MQFGTYRVICKIQRFIFCLRLYVFSMHSLRVPTFFILFVTASVSPMMSTVLHAQRFLFCLSPYLFSEWHIVPQLCIQIKQSRVTLVKLYMNVKQVEDSENRCGVFIGFCLPPTQQRPQNPHQPPILFIILLFASLILDISMEFRYTCVVFMELCPIPSLMTAMGMFISLATLAQV